MTSRRDLAYASARIVETIRRARDLTCPACLGDLDDPPACTLCNGTRTTEPRTAVLFDVDDVATLIHALTPETSL